MPRLLHYLGTQPHNEKLKLAISMNWSKFFSLFTLALTLIAEATPSSGKEPSEDIKPLAWPEASRPKILLTLHTRTEDGYSEQVLHFKIPGGAIIQVEKHGYWAKTKPNPRYSIQLEESKTPDLKFGISAFQKNEFLASLNREDWERYLHHLNTSNPNQKVVFEQSNLEGSGRLFVLGKKYREVSYEWQTAAGKTKKTREIFFFLDEHLHVISFYGAPESVDTTWKLQRTLLSRMRLIPSKRK